MGVPTALMQRLLLVSSPSRAGIGIIPVSPRTAPRHPAAEVGVLRKKRITGICFTPAHQGKKKNQDLEDSSLLWDLSCAALLVSRPVPARSAEASLFKLGFFRVFSGVV